MNLEDYVFFINDPRNPYETNYSVDYLTNIQEGHYAKYLNMPMDIIKSCVKIFKIFVKILISFLVRY